MKQLQKMLDICFHCGKYFDVVFNAKKSTLFMVGKELHMGPYNISQSQTMKSLGVAFKAYNSLATDVDRTIRKFYASANAILSHVKFASEMSKL